MCFVDLGFDLRLLLEDLHTQLCFCPQLFELCVDLLDFLKLLLYFSIACLHTPQPCSYVVPLRTLPGDFVLHYA